MEAMGGARGLLGLLIASGVVALPIGLLVYDTVAKAWPQMHADANRVVMVLVVWVLVIVWGLWGPESFRRA